MIQPVSITAPVETRNTRLAAVWRVFGHLLDPAYACVLMQEGKDHWTEFRFQRTGTDASPGQLEGWWNAFPQPLREFQDTLASLLTGGDVDPPKINKLQWGAYVCVMRLAWRVYEAHKKQFDEAGMQLPARRIHVAMATIRELRGESHRDEDVLRWYSDDDGQRRFEAMLAARAADAKVGHEYELWEAQWPAYTTAIREVFNAYDVLMVYYEKARDAKQTLVQTRSRGRVLNVSPYMDSYTVRELKREGGM